MPDPQHQSLSKNIVRRVTLVTQSISTSMMTDSGHVIPVPTALSPTSEQTMTSNLSKIRPKLRTEGRVSGNFGRNKVKAGSQIADLGVTKAESVSIIPRGKYVEKMEMIYFNPPNEKMRNFAYQELQRLHYFQVQRLERAERTERPFRTPGA